MLTIVTGLDALPQWAAELLESGRVAHLGLLDEDGAPRVQPVTYARVGPVLWSAVDDKPKRRPGELPARIRRLRAHPRVALTVDRYAEDWARLAWVQVLGDITIVEADGEALAALAARYAPYRERPPRGPLLRLEPRRVLCWRA
jgi:PPOX class probable F420-dependent enzyme